VTDPTTPEGLLRVIRAISNNTKAVFVRGRGQIMSILSDEFGLALLQLRPNQWSSVLFHRSVCFLQRLSLSKLSLHKTLKEGEINTINAAIHNSYMLPNEHYIKIY
jgi:hypothetical protein